MFKKCFASSSETDQLRALQRLDLKEVQKFIAKGMDVNQSFTEYQLKPLHFAVNCAGSTELLEYLLQQPDIQIDAGDKDGVTPLMYAAIDGEIKACCLLIAHGADYQRESLTHKQNALELFKESRGAFFDHLESAVKKREESLLKANPVVIDSTKDTSNLANSGFYRPVTQRKAFSKTEQSSTRFPSWLLNRSKKRKDEEEIALIPTTLNSNDFNNKSSKINSCSELKLI